MKTYLPKLSLILLLVCRYILRWNVQIKANIPEESAPLVDAVLAACQALEIVVVEAIGPRP